MVATIASNPILTTNTTGLFNATSVGLVQGTAYPDPAIRYKLAGGVLAPTETLPMWGGVGIYTDIPGASGGPVVPLGPSVGRATALTGSKALIAFSVFDQAYGMINSPQSPVPLAASYMQVMYYRLGSGARIAVACDPALISLQGSLTTSEVSWDFASQLLVPYTPAYSGASISGATWAGTSGGQTTFTVGSDLTGDLSAGSDIDVSGVVSTGGTGIGYNGRFTVVSVTSSTIVVSQPAAASPGTYSSGGTVAGGGGALPVQVLDVSAANNQIVAFNPATGFATWNFNGAAAVILI